MTLGLLKGDIISDFFQKMILAKTRYKTHNNIFLTIIKTFNI